MSGRGTAETQPKKQNRVGHSCRVTTDRRRIEIFMGRLLLLVLVGDYIGVHISSKRLGSPEMRIAPLSQQLTPSGHSQLTALINSATLSELRWPQFRNLQTKVRRLYDCFPGTLPWVRESRPTPQALAMIELLKAADEEGLDPEDYDGPHWDKCIASMEGSTSASEANLVRFDVALTVSTMRFVSDLRLGRMNHRSFRVEASAGDSEGDLSNFLSTQVVNAPDVSYVIKAMEPAFPSYGRTLVALKNYRRFASEDAGERFSIPQNPVKPGDPYANLPRLTKLLTLLGDLPQNKADSSSQSIYEGVFVDAVKRFQQRHGLEPNGLIDPGTVRELNTPLARRVSQLPLTLERFRWVPPEIKPPMLVVNIPEFRLRAVDKEYRWNLFMKVVVGKAYRHQTPVFAAELESIIFRPYWNVPLSITRREILPHIETLPSKLSAEPTPPA